jgi:hypothetical protein
MKTSTFSHSGPGAYDQLKGKDRILFDKVCVEIVKSKKIVVVAGAGLSCSSGIPVSFHPNLFGPGQDPVNITHTKAIRQH